MIEKGGRREGRISINCINMAKMLLGALGCFLLVCLTYGDEKAFVILMMIK